MKKFAVMCSLVVVAGCSALPIDGMSRAGWDGPANLPPVGYAKETWVDARGCVFFATGSTSNRGWAPYIGSGLNQVCKG